MNKLLAIVLMLVTTNVFAGQWMLEKSDYVPGTGWICTYQLSGTQYYQTIIQKSYCQMFIYN